MDLRRITNAIMEKRAAIPAARSVLAGISGIDASGKGLIASKLRDYLEAEGLRTALINADDWLNLPSVRFSDTNAGQHFYENALRLDEMFGSLVLTLKRDREVELVAEIADETDDVFRRGTYDLHDIDVILLEGIFLFKEKYREVFDLKIWIECSFAIALERAVRRSQEGLGREETIKVYETVYFPAQRHHFLIDDPFASANLTFPNGNTLPVQA